ncbi:hypothetical protein GV827_16895 [Sulfitobacter sp. JBTF-M27]|uniref:Uncharacterized protein n=1 Tax=Sulfitobacter sediminilitoris TaxID=2698830 RepID=A0A6P0CCY9_9RHOB|nr:hypothetical protein [Sulfitobacter sediminilitoris]NEK24069.1 hypothetical protein [Sulfitobacter sediminilitoris]
MPFDDLSDKQQKFILNYLRTPKFKNLSKTKRLKAEFNDKLRSEMTDLYEEIKALDIKLDAVLKDHPGGDEAFQRFQIREAEHRVNRTTKAGAVAMKKSYEIPDFSADKAFIFSVSRDIDLFRKRCEDAEAFAASVTGHKDAYFNDIIDRLHAHENVALAVFGPACAGMKTALQPDLKARDAAIATYNGLLSTALKAAVELRKNEVSKSEVTLDAFKGKADVILADLTRDGDVQVAIVKSLFEKPGPTNQDCLGFLDDNQDLEVVKLEKDRQKLLVSAKAELTSAVKLQQKKVDDLRKEFKTAKGGKRDELRAEYREVQGHLDGLNDRLGQLTAFDSEEHRVERAKRIIETEQKLSNADLQADEVAQLLENGHAPEIAAFDQRLIENEERLKAAKTSKDGGIDYFPVIENFDTLRTQNVMLRKQVEKSAKREILAEQIFPEEPKLMEISEDQEKTLLKMLTNAMTCITDENAKYASVLHYDVSQLWQAFLLQRRMGLPVPPPPLPDETSRLKGILDPLEAIARDHWGQGNPEAQAKLDAIQAFRTEIDARKAELTVSALGGVQDTSDNPYDEIEGRIGSLATEIKNMETVSVDTPETTQAKEKATATSAAVNDELIKLYRTQEIKNTDLIEVPGKKYTAKESKKIIPLDEVLTITDSDGTERKFRIKTRTAGGQDLNRRKNKDVPRDMMDNLKQRADTLALMAEMTADGCEGALDAYADQTQKLLDEISNDGPANFKLIQEIIDFCDTTFKTSPVKSYLTENYGKVKTAYDAFGVSYATKLPSEALKEAKDHKKAVEKLKTASAALKERYKNAKALSMELSWELSSVLSDSGLAAPDEIGQQMASFIEGGAERLLAECNPVTDEDKAKIALARDKIKASAKWFSDNREPPQNMAGTWRKDLDSTFRLLEGKTYSAVDDAEKKLGEIDKEIAKMKSDMGKTASMDGPELMAFVISIADKMEDMAFGIADQNAYIAECKTKKAALEARLKDTKNVIKKHGNNSVKELCESKQTALENGLKTAVATYKKQFTYEEGSAELDKISEQITELEGTLSMADAGEKEDVKLMKVAPKLPAIVKFIELLKTTAAKLPDDKIRPNVTEETIKEFAGIDGGIDVVETSLRRVASLPPITNLESLASQIDKAIDNKSGTKALRIDLREKALAELHQIRSAVETHPAIQLYKDNPFDLGTKFVPIKSAFHQVEIAILACVSPKEKN